MIEKAESPNIRILLIDDHVMFLAALRLLIEAEPGMVVIGHARNRNEAIEAARALPDIILLDLNLATESSADFLPDLVRAAENARILALTGVPDPEVHLRALCLGAVGVVLKSEAADVLLKAIRKVHAGEVWVNRTMMAAAVTQIHTRRPKNSDPDAARIASLTVREREVISWVGEAYSNKRIGERLFISEKTVRHYLTSTYSKLGVSDRQELMIYAYQHSLAKLPDPKAGCA